MTPFAAATLAGTVRQASVRAAMILTECILVKQNEQQLGSVTAQAVSLGFDSRAYLCTNR